MVGCDSLVDVFATYYVICSPQCPIAGCDCGPGEEHKNTNDPSISLPAYYYSGGMYFILDWIERYPTLNVTIDGHNGQN